MTVALRPAPPAPDPDADRLAQVAAKVIGRVGMDAVRAHLPRITVTAPRVDSAVLACACGQVLDADDMCWSGSGRYGNGDPKLGRIACRACAGRSS